MTHALIGHTGFVGGNLRRQLPFDSFFNSANIADLRGQRFESITCAGVRAVKWQANKDPVSDRQQIAVLEAALSEVEVKRFVLISTIDVYPVLSEVDEGFDCHSDTHHAYGTHRLELEQFCQRRFEDCTVVRLPALFGPGLKKNVIFDLMHDKLLAAINPESSFQYYDLTWLARDLERVREAGVKLINLFPAPLATREIVDELFPGKELGREAAPAMHYDLRTRHGALWGRSDGYMAGAGEVMQALSSYVRGERMGKGE